jgi:hypothetical protein
MYTKALGGTYNCTLERTPSEGFQVYGTSHSRSLCFTGSLTDRAVSPEDRRPVLGA